MYDGGIQMKKKVTGKHKKELESSIRGYVLRQMIAHVTNDHLIGKKIKSGEMRKNLVEPKWKCPKLFTMEEIVMPHFTMELLSPKEGAREDFILLQLHGGGYIGAMRNAYRTFAGLYSEVGKGLKVLTIDYRVAPENPYPAALLDALTAYDWLLEQGWEEQQIIVAGDSAGGGLALALCMFLKDNGRKLPGGIIAMSPWTDLTASGPSYQENYEKDPLFGNTRDSLIYNKDYVGDHDPKNPYISPLFGDFTGFPPMLLQVGSVEMLLSDSVLAAEKAKAAGVKVKLTVYEGMFHIFQMALKLLPESRAAWVEIERFLKIICRKETKPMKFSEMPYKRLDIEDAKKRYEELMKRLKEAKSGSEQWAIHQDNYKLLDEIETYQTIASIRHDIDTTDEFYEKEQEYYDEVLPILDQYQVEYQKELFASPYREYLEQQIGPVAFKNMELSFKAFDESLVPLMQEENALATRYGKVIATAQIPFEGEVYNLSLMRKFLTDSDRSVRRRAWKAVSDYFLSVTNELEGIYDKLLKNRTKQARMLGYENFVELGYYRMNRNSYGREEVEKFREQVKEYFVPFASKIHERRRARIGVEKLSYVDQDVYFKEGNPAPVGTPEEIMAAGQRMYGELSPETKEFFDFMQENQLFDVLSRKTKRQGGYMTYIPLFESPFIFANFNGTSSDVDVITHECGHAFQGYVVRNEEVREHRDITMETAEIHSMSMEYFTYGWMKEFFGDRMGDYLAMHLEDSAAFVPYGCMVDEFQHIVYENPDMTPAQRKEAWMELEHVYRPYLDYEEDPFFGAGGWWQKQSHIFQCPFYYIDYCLASICAMQYKKMMDEDFGKAWESYLALCRLSAKKFYVPMLEEAGLTSPFAEGCIKIVAHFEKQL